MSAVILLSQISLLGCQLDTAQNSEIETDVEITKQTDIAQQQSELTSNSQLWAQLAPKDYSFSIRQSCFCLLPV